MVVGKLAASIYIGSRIEVGFGLIGKTRSGFSLLPLSIRKEMHRGGGGSSRGGSSSRLPGSLSSLSTSSQSRDRGRHSLDMEGNSHNSRGHGGGRGCGSSSSADISNTNIHNSFSSLSISSGSGSRGRSSLNAERNHQKSSGRGAGGGATTNRIDALDRLLTRVLRHMATELKLDMRCDGYVRVKDLLKLKLKSRANIPLSAHSLDEIQEAVRVDNKQRLSLLEENGELLIRANQGHSDKVVQTESLLKPILSADEIPVCVHGTYKRFLESILHSGLKRMSRLHVHFSRGMPSDGEVISGMRHDVNLVIFLDAKKALEDGMKFYVSENKVILTEGFDGIVPVKYFERIETWPGRKPVPFQK